jgi:hypothetical protein
MGIGPLVAGASPDLGDLRYAGRYIPVERGAQYLGVQPDDPQSSEFAPERATGVADDAFYAA